ncbi:MAG: hypothetical protein JNJ61_17525 [Anaerolineae bacterium]|nr:hypothetical protein [Anaerolineae bacterium]
MSNTPNPLNKQSLSRASIVGIGLAVLGIALFLVLWIVFGQSGMETLPRLIVSLCVPPAIIAALIGAYVLFVRPGNPPQS